MARVDFSAYALVIPEGQSIAVPEYFALLRENGLVPQRWLDAKHAGDIIVSRDPVTNAVVVSSGLVTGEGNE